MAGLTCCFSQPADNICPWTLQDVSSYGVLLYLWLANNACFLVSRK